MLEMLRTIKSELERVAKSSPDKFDASLGEPGNESLSDRKLLQSF